MVDYDIVRIPLMLDGIPSSLVPCPRSRDRFDSQTN